jgi:CBS-domain-containing membrane protein
MTVGIYKLHARDVMTRGADTIRDDETIHTAIETLVNLGLSALPVVNREDQCVGVLTKTDIIRMAGRLDQEETPEDRDELALFFGVSLDEITDAKVKDVMTKRALSVSEDDPVTTVADKMLKHEIHHVTVCNQHDKVVGMISSMDLVKAICQPISS